MLLEHIPAGRKYTQVNGDRRSPSPEVQGRQWPSIRHLCGKGLRRRRASELVTNGAINCPRLGSATGGTWEPVPEPQSCHFRCLLALVTFMAQGEVTSAAVARLRSGCSDLPCSPVDRLTMTDLRCPPVCWSDWLLHRWVYWLSRASVAAMCGEV